MGSDLPDLRHWICERAPVAGWRTIELQPGSGLGAVRRSSRPIDPVSIEETFMATGPAGAETWRVNSGLENMI